MINEYIKKEIAIKIAYWNTKEYCKKGEEKNVVNNYAKMYVG